MTDALTNLIKLNVHDVDFCSVHREITFLYLHIYIHEHAAAKCFSKIQCKYIQVDLHTSLYVIVIVLVVYLWLWSQLLNIPIAFITAPPLFFSSRSLALLRVVSLQQGFPIL